MLLEHGRSALTRQSAGAQKRWLLSAAIAALCASAGCDSEVTLRLLSDVRTGSGGQAGIGGSSDAGDGGSSDVSAGGEAGESTASGGNGGGDLPAPCQKLGTELCNGGDDDCNGFVDDECSYSLVWSRDPQGAALGHVTGGFTFLQLCPEGSVVTGLRVGMGTRLDQVAPICQQVELQVDATLSPTSFTFTVGARHDLSIAPQTSFEPSYKSKDLRCPEGMLLSGVDGTAGLGPQYLVQRIRLTCAPPATTTDLLLDIDHDQDQLVDPVECTDCSASPTYNFGMTIAPGHVGSGLFGGVGAWVDRVGFASSQARIVNR